MKKEYDTQKLIDITFQIGLAIHNENFFKDKNKYDVAEWISQQLRECGFDTHPCGASWDVLEK